MKGVLLICSTCAVTFFAGCQSLPRLETVATQWRVLLHEGGCLTGGQDWRASGISEGSVLHDPAWQEFLAQPLGPTVRFLLEHLESTAETGLHVCPHQPATEGEMALYALQLRLSANWVDMPSGIPVVKEAKLLHRSHRQNAARMLLADRAARRELRDYFFDKSDLTMTEGEQLERYRADLRPETVISLWPDVVAETEPGTLFMGGSFRTPAGSYRSALLVSRNGGKAWEDTGVWRVAGEVVDLYVLDAKRAWMVTGHSVEGSMGPYRVWRTVDGGRTWQRSPVELPQRHVGIDYVNSWSFSDRNNGTMVIAGSMQEKVTYTTRDGGMTWKEVAYERYNDAEDDEHAPVRQKRRFRADVEYENGVVSVKRLDVDGQWVECGRLPHRCKLRKEPLFPQ